MGTKRVFERTKLCMEVWKTAGVETAEGAILANGIYALSLQLPGKEDPPIRVHLL